MFEISGVGSCALCMFWYLSLSSDNGEGGCETWKCCTSIFGKTVPTFFSVFTGPRCPWDLVCGSSLNQAVCDWERFLRLNWYHYVTLVDEDINSILADQINRAISGNLEMQVAPPDDQIWIWCKWHHLEASFCMLCKWLLLVAKFQDFNQISGFQPNFF